MATTSIAIVVFIVQGIWCLPLEVGVSSGSGGGQSGNYQLTSDSGASGLMSLMSRMLMGNQVGQQLGTNLMNRAMNVPASAVNHLVSGLQLSNGGNAYGTQGGISGLASNVNAQGMLKALGDMAGTALEVTDKGVQLGTGGAKMGAELVGQTSSAMKDTVKDLINGGQIFNVPNSHTVTSGFNYNSGASSGYGNGFDVNVPSKGIMNTVRDMAGSAVDMVNQGVQMKVKGAQVIPEMAGQTSSAMNNIVKNIIGSTGIEGFSSSNLPKTHSVSSTYEYKSGGNSNGGSPRNYGGASKDEYSYGLNLPGTGVMSTVRDMAGSAVDMVDQGVQMKVKGAQVIPEMAGQTSSAMNNIVKNIIGSTGIEGFSSSVLPNTHSVSSTYEYKTGGNSNGGTTGNYGESSKAGYSNGINMPGAGVMSTVRDMAGSAIDMVNQGVQMGTKGAQVIPEMAGQTSSAMNNIVKNMIGSTGIEGFSSSNLPNTHSVSSSYEYKSGSNSNGGSPRNYDKSSKNEISYSLNMPGTGVMSTVRDMAGSAIDMVNQGVQMGTKGAQVIPEMEGQASSAMKNIVKNMIGGTGIEGFSSSNLPSPHSVSSTYEYKSSGNSNGGSSKAGYSYGINMPGAGVMSTVRDMAGSAVDMVDQGVQMGTKSAQVIPEMAGQTSSAMTNAMKAMIGSPGVGGTSSSNNGNANSVTSTYKYQSGGNLLGGSTGNSRGSSYGDSAKYEYSSGLNMPRIGMMSGVSDLAGSAIDMADQSVQMGSKSAKVIPNMTGQMSSAVSNTMKEMIGSSKSGEGSSSSTVSDDEEEITESSS